MKTDVCAKEECPMNILKLFLSCYSEERLAKHRPESKLRLAMCVVCLPDFLLELRGYPAGFLG